MLFIAIHFPTHIYNPFA